MLTKVVLPICHRLHIAQRVIDSILAQTVPVEVVLIAQNPEAVAFAEASGLEWAAGETGGPGDR